jgi:hypothetical protein
MYHRLAAVFAALAVIALAMPLNAQTRRPPARKPAVAVPPKKEAPEIVCPAPLGVGVNTRLEYCDVMSERDPSAGVIIRIPEHKGPVTLTFDLHNRHTYSEEQVKTNRAYSRYTATVGVLTMDNTLLTRAVVQNEFRKVTDFVDRIGGGAGSAGIKAVGPTGTESVSVVIPEEEMQVSILGEKVMVERADGTATYSSPGRPVAIMSNAMIEYRPAPPPKPAAAAPRKR